MENAILKSPREAAAVQETAGMKTCPIHLNHMLTGYLIFLAGISIPIGLAYQPGTPVDVQWIMMTLAGAMVASSSAFLLNKSQESALLVVGRAFFSAVTGVVATRLAYHKIDWVKELLAIDPILMFGAGFAAGLAGYLGAVYLMKRAPKAVEDQIDHWLPKPPQPLTPLPDDIRHADKNKPHD